MLLRAVALLIVSTSTTQAAIQPNVLAHDTAIAIGEVATYRASWGIFSRAGTAVLSVTRDSLRGESLAHATLAVTGGIPGARINERLETWIDEQSLASRQFMQRTRYPGFSRDRVRQFDARTQRWFGSTNSKPDSGQLPTSRPIDDLSAILLARSLPLVVGTDIVLNDNWRTESNPIVLKVLRKETVSVPAGT